MVSVHNDKAEEDLDDSSVVTADQLDNSCDYLQMVLNGESSSTSVIALPPHHPCSSHMASLIAVTRHTGSTNRKRNIKETVQSYHGQVCCTVEQCIKIGEMH